METGGTAISFLLTFWKRAEQPFPFCIRCFDSKRTCNDFSTTSVCSAKLIMTLFTQPIRQRRRLYRLLSLGIKEVHFQELGRRCPSHVHRITSLSILPRVFDTDCTTRTLTCQQLTEEWELPHSGILSDILRELILAKHADTPPVSWTSFMLTCYRILEFRLNTEPNFPRSINRIYTWNLTRWTPQYPSNKHKNNFISRALKKGPVLLQETKWTNEHYRHMLHTWPEIPLAHSPAISLHNGLSGGTAILLPPAWSIMETVEIVPGYVIAVKAKQAGYLVWFVSMYTKIPLDRHWMQRTLTSTAQTIKGQPAFIGIDCNKVDKTFPELWTNFLMQADLVDIAPELDTYFYQGGSSPLDRILVPSLMVDAALQQPIACTSMTSSDISQCKDGYNALQSLPFTRIRSNMKRYQQLHFVLQSLCTIRPIVAFIMLLWAG